MGRFTTQDPKEYVDGLNTYAYVKNNPVNGIDRLGLSTECIDITGNGVYGRYLDGIMTGDCELKPVDEEYSKWQLKDVIDEGGVEPGTGGGPGIPWMEYSCLCVKCRHVVIEGNDNNMECGEEDQIGGGITSLGSGYAWEDCTNKCDAKN